MNKQTEKLFLAMKQRVRVACTKSCCTYSLVSFLEENAIGISCLDPKVLEKRTVLRLITA